jgi:NUDIX domain
MVIHKIGVVPLTRIGEPKSVRLLIHKPCPKQGELDIAWGLARGTRMFYDIDEGQWRDARERTTAEMFRDRLEDPIHTAWREMQEELAVTKSDLEGGILRDLGVITYDSTQRMAYPIHWFSGWVINPDIPRDPEDAADIAWITLEELRLWAETGKFKASYLPIAEQIMATMIG